MKNIFYFAIILSLVFASSCSKNKDDGTWNTSLGKAKFATAQTWEISNGSITQKWSDAVEIIGAQYNYQGYNTTDGYKIAFSANKLGYKGSLFSWRAVAETANLCPPPWRVPTKDDFVNLDIAMCGGDGSDRTLPFDVSKYLDTWGGAFGGSCDSNGLLTNQDNFGNYWSQSEFDGDLGFRLSFGTNGNIRPQNRDGKRYGFTLRCVRN